MPTASRYSTATHHPSYSAVHWIKALAQTQAFADALADVWPAVKSDMQRVYDYVTRIGELCAASDAVNYERWPQFEKAEIKAYCANVNAIMKDNVEWIDQILTLRLFALTFRP